VVSGGLVAPASAFSEVPGQPGIYTADLIRLGVTPSDLGAFPSVGATVDGCDQLQFLKMQLWHDGTSTHLARYPNLLANGDWAFLNAVAGAASGFTVRTADQARVMRWISEEAPVAQGYWDWDWADQILQVRCKQRAEYRCATLGHAFRYTCRSRTSAPTREGS
jgi:hypothetical protein